MFNISFFLRIVLLFFFVGMQTTFAQPPDNPPPPEVPISGIEILIGLGALFGAKNFFDFRKHKN